MKEHKTTKEEEQILRNILEQTRGLKYAEVLAIFGSLICFINDIANNDKELEKLPKDNFINMMIDSLKHFRDNKETREELVKHFENIKWLNKYLTINH